jgi:hypothetical protein
LFLKRSSPPSARAARARCTGARDTKLKRDVALKVLPEAFARDPEFRTLLLSGTRQNLSISDFVLEVVRIEAVDPAFVRYSLRIHHDPAT